MEQETVVALGRRWNLIKERCDRLLGVRQQLESSEKKLTSEIDLLSIDVRDYTEAAELLKHLQTVLVDESISEIEGLVNQGLRDVFPDQNLKFRIEQSIKRGLLHLEFYLTDKVEAPLLESYGGGVVCVVSFLLRLIAIKKLGLKSNLFLDESFSQLSAEYVPTMALLLRDFADRMGMNIFLITHQPKFLDEAHLKYVCDDDGGGLTISPLVE